MISDKATLLRVGTNVSNIGTDMPLAAVAYKGVSFVSRLDGPGCTAAFRAVKAVKPGAELSLQMAEMENLLGKKPFITETLDAGGVSHQVLIVNF